MRTDIWVCGCEENMVRKGERCDICGSAEPADPDPPSSADQPAATVRDHVLASIPRVNVDTDAGLLRTALRALRPDPGESALRWSLVGSALGHGSGVSWAICDALGLPPDEEVHGPPPRCPHCCDGMRQDEDGWWCAVCGPDRDEP